MALTIRTIGIQMSEAAENHVGFVQDMLTLVREDFRHDLAVMNIAQLAEVDFDTLHGNQLATLGFTQE